MWQLSYTTLFSLSLQRKSTPPHAGVVPSLEFGGDVPAGEQPPLLDLCSPCELMSPFKGAAHSPFPRGSAVAPGGMLSSRPSAVSSNSSAQLVPSMSESPGSPGVPR